MILYLSGPITGVKDYKARFKHAQITLEMAGKQTVLNPAVMPEGLKEYDDYIRISLSMLCAADGIVMLPGWKKSRGARIELQEALKAGKKIFFGVESVMRKVAPEAKYELKVIPETENGVKYHGSPVKLRGHGEMEVYYTGHKGPAEGTVVVRKP